MDFLFYLTLFLFLAIFGAIDTQIDYDFWARLIVGKSFFQTGTLFNQDFYSYGTTHEFIDHEWGSSLIFYLLQSNFGDVGLYFFKTIMLFLVFFVITKIIKLEKPDSRLHFLFFFFAIQTISILIFGTIRCHIFSFFFFVFYLYILKYIKITKNYRLFWCFPVLNIVWANLHGGFTLGIVLIAIFALGEFLNNRKDKYWKLCLCAFIASCFTTLINPYGIKYIIFIFEAFTLKREFIMEWHSVFLRDFARAHHIKYIVYFAAAQLFFLFALLKNIKQNGFKKFYSNIDKTKYLMIIFVSLIALKAIRCHTFFIFTLLAFCYNDFYNIFNKQLPVVLDKIKAHLLLYLIFISCFSRVYNFGFLNTLKEINYPIYAIEFLQANKIYGNTICDFHIGSYLAYKLYPNNYVFMDGRYEEVYDVNLINDLGKIFLSLNYKALLNKYHTDIIIIDNKYGLKNTLSKNKKWFKAWEDANFTLYLSEKFKGRKFIEPIKDKNYYYKSKYDTSIDWLK